MTAPEVERQPLGANSEVLISPFVTWIHLVLAYDPASRPTESRMKTLRNHRACPEGVKVPVRTATGVAGSRSWYSSAGLWSAVLLRSGYEDEAIALVERANRQIFQHLVALNWNDVSLSEPNADVLSLALETWQLVQEATLHLNLSLSPGAWAWIRDDKAVITTSAGEEFTLAQESPHLVQSRLGDPVVVVHEQTDNGTELRYVLPGIRIAEPFTSHEAQQEEGDLHPGAGGLHGEIPNTHESGTFFQRLFDEAAGER